MPTIHERFTERTELARVYAEDGAFYSAARVLRELAQDIQKHAKWCDQCLRAAETQPLSKRTAAEIERDQGLRVREAMAKDAASVPNYPDPKR